MRATKNKPFLLKEHFVRLKKYAAAVKLALPFTEKEFTKILDKLLKGNGFKESTIRTVMTGGESIDSFLPGKPTCYILIEDFQALPKAMFEKGVGVATIEFSRHMPHVKITNYVEAIKNNSLKKRLGAFEITYIRDGKVLENSTSNIFIFKGNTLITASEGVLLGTIRNLAVKLAKKKFKVEEREITEKEFRNADEAFLTATNKDILPVVKIDGKRVGNGKVGNNTKVMMELFRQYSNNY
jgi:branched-chain amino acid aminotransferase